MESHPHWIVENLWLIPILPFAAALITALLKQSRLKISATVVILAMLGSFLLSLCAISHVLPSGDGGHGHGVQTLTSTPFVWFSYGGTAIRLGFLLDPLSAMMLFVVTLVSLLVFIFSVGYMDHDENATRFFCFLSLFAGSMLMLVIANSLLLLFMAWELVGLSSFLLIGFWYHKPSAMAAMKKAFITTRIGDVGFLIGLVWFYHATGNSLFYEAGKLGSLEGDRLLGIGSAAFAISLLIFCGAAGKSGQFPLHVWLPDAMEGPTPVSALIHAATMVAAGVFLVARMFPVFALDQAALGVVALVGAFTALFAATIAVAQWDIKRILAYSTVSQLGYMMMGLGVGGYVAGSFHLFTHAFFKALLFLGSGAIIYACHHEQDIRKMGGLKEKMPITFVCYMIGMLALAGFPGLAGFFSKDELLLSAFYFEAKGLPIWLAKVPFIFALMGAFLTAFYMTRQIKYVFWGKNRSHGSEHAHEAPGTMVGPLIVLAIMSIAAGFLGFPGKNFMHHFLAPDSHEHAFSFAIMGGSVVIVFLAIFAGWTVYSGKALEEGAMDPIEARFPGVFRVLNNKYYIDEFYAKTIIGFNAILSRVLSIFDRFVINGFIVCLGWLFLGLSKINQAVDDIAINGGFDKGCETIRGTAQWNRWIQNGLAQHYLKLTSAGLVLIFLLVIFLGRN